MLVFEGLDLPFSYQVHFSNEALHGSAIPQVGANDRVDIPNVLLESGAPIYFWIYLNETESDGQTEYWGLIPVNARSKPEDYEPTPEQEDVFQETLAALNAGVGAAEAAVEHYPRIVNGVWYVWDAETEDFVSTGVDAEGMSPTVSVTEITGGHRVTIADTYGDHVFDVVNGDPGQDGVSPTVSVSEISGGHRVVITDKSGTKTFDVPNGQDGHSPAASVTQTSTGATISITDQSGTTTANVSNGTDGYSPTASVNKSGSTVTITVTDKTGTTAAQVNDGQDGVSPTVTVTNITGGHRLTITDAEGTRTVDVLDGTDGDDGKGIASIAKSGASGLTDTYTITYTDGTTSTFTVTNGADGYSPTASVSKSGRTATITITDKTGTTTAQVSDGQDGAPGVGIPAGGTDGQMLVKDGATDYSAKWANQPTAPVQDVQVNGTSVLSNGVANVPIAGPSRFGAVQVSGYGLQMQSNGYISTKAATQAEIKSGTRSWEHICPGSQDYSTFYGLAKAAGSDEKNSRKPFGTYTDAAKIAIQKMLGLWTPKAYVKKVLTEDDINTGTIALAESADVTLEIYEEFVIFIYQSDRATHNSEWGSGSFGYMTIRDVVNDGYIAFNYSPNNYLDEKATTTIRIKRLPSCLIPEIQTGANTKIGYAIRDINYLDTIRWFTINSNTNATLYAGCTIEAYIHRFI